ncbi:hypothetical protein CRG98_004265 [Punica granatum]|uniref:Single-stranded DNA binding protein Ssb-like OB fold domain-containing protein n=1 Tax=Punica granatum TaxID=22663 RepID=A0A2I0L3N9_PUNGR|nr:hypothetical protein CRG98_004265 [Punica granatum]
MDQQNSNDDDVAAHPESQRAEISGDHQYHEHQAFQLSGASSSSSQAPQQPEEYNMWTSWTPGGFFHGDSRVVNVLQRGSSSSLFSVDPRRYFDSVNKDIEQENVHHNTTSGTKDESAPQRRPPPTQLQPRPATGPPPERPARPATSPPAPRPATSPQELYDIVKEDIEQDFQQQSPNSNSWPSPSIHNHHINHGSNNGASSAGAAPSSELKQPIEEVVVELRKEISGDANDITVFVEEEKMVVGQEEAQPPSLPTGEPMEQLQDEEEAAAAKQWRVKWPEHLTENLADAKRKCEDRMGAWTNSSSSATSEECFELQVEQEVEVPLEPANNANNIKNNNEHDREVPLKPEDKANNNSGSKHEGEVPLRPQINANNGNNRRRRRRPSKQKVHNDALVIIYGPFFVLIPTLVQLGRSIALHVDQMKEGSTVILRNANIEMFRGSMRLAVDSCGRIEATEPASFTVKEDCNLSLIEFESVKVVK